MARRAEWRTLLAAILLTTALLLAGSASAIEVSVHDLSVSAGAVYGDLVLLPVGETVTIGIRVEDSTASIWTGFGLSYYGYDAGLLDFVDGEAVPSIFGDTCFALPTPFCANEMFNFAGNAVGSGNRILEEGAVFPAVPLAGTPRVRAFFVFEHLSSIIGKAGGPDDRGLDGVLGGGDAHARVTFEGLSDGITEITIGTGDDLGGILLGPDGVTVPGGATNARVRLAVPEPSTARMLVVAFGSLMLLGRRQLSQ